MGSIALQNKHDDKHTLSNVYMCQFHLHRKACLLELDLHNSLEIISGKQAK